MRLCLAAAPKLVSPLSASGGKLVKPMMTLVEEQHNREIKPLLNQDTEDVSVYSKTICCPKVLLIYMEMYFNFLFTLVQKEERTVKM